jgi:hypothetical protein
VFTAQFVNEIVRLISGVFTRERRAHDQPGPVLLGQPISFVFVGFHIPAKGQGELLPVTTGCCNQQTESVKERQTQGTGHVGDLPRDIPWQLALPEKWLGTLADGRWPEQFNFGQGGLGDIFPRSRSASGKYQARHSKRE